MYSIISFLFNAASILLNLLPRFFVKWFSKGIAFLWYWVFPFRVNLILANLKLAYKHEKTNSEIKKIAKDNLCHYIYLALEFIQLRTFMEKNLNPIEIENMHLLLEAQKEERGIIFLTAHLGNFEWMAAKAPAIGLPLHIIVRPMKVKVLEDLIHDQRCKTGVGLLGPKDSVWKIFTLLAEKKIVGIIFDQRKGSDAVLVNFFNKPALTAKGLAYVVEKSQALVLPVYAFRKDYGDIVIRFDSPISYKKVGTRKENIYHNTQVYTDAIEHMVRQHPEQWFWIHNRWKQ